MNVYYGVVHGRTVTLPDDAELDEGTVVEVHAMAGRHRSLSDVAADLELQYAIMAVGLIREIGPVGTAVSESDPPRLQIAGAPVSETVIAERR